MQEQNRRCQDWPDLRLRRAGAGWPGRGSGHRLARMQAVGRYRIEKEIGRGAMGVVYLAHDPTVRRPVAVKVYQLPQGLAAHEEEELRERFLREAQAAGALSHPAIVTVYDAGQTEDSGVPYIAMEYVSGDSLRDLLEREGRLSVSRAVRIAGDLAEALGAAHAQGVIHRDVKPANVLVRQPDGAVKIADFGIARLASSELTRSGLTLGSPAYMSPEQVRGRPVDGRGDLFSLAVILYQMICGRRPFAGEDLSALAYAVAHETPAPIGRQVPGLPGALDRFFERALAKDPGARYPSGDSFRRALLEAVGDEAAADPRRRPDLGPEATPPPRVAETTIVLEESSGPRPSELWVAAGSLLRRSARPLAGALGVAWRVSSLRAALVATVVLIAAMSGWWAWAATRASLVLEARSSIEAGRLTLLVDGQEVYQKDLAAERKAATAFGRKVFEYGQERFEVRIRVSPGKHDVIARVETDDLSEPLTDRTVVDLERGESRTLRLVAGRALGAPLTLTSH